MVDAGSYLARYDQPVPRKGGGGIRRGTQSTVRIRHARRVTYSCYSTDLKHAYVHMYVRVPLVGRVQVLALKGMYVHTYTRETLQSSFDTLQRRGLSYTLFHRSLHLLPLSPFLHLPRPDLPVPFSCLAPEQGGVVWGRERIRKILTYEYVGVCVRGSLWLRGRLKQGWPKDQGAGVGGV